MSGNKSKKNIAVSAPSKHSIAATTVKKAPAGSVASKPVVAPLMAVPDDCRVEVAVESALASQTVQSQPLNGTARSNKTGPSFKGPASSQMRAAASTKETSNVSVPVRDTPAVNAVSRALEPETKPDTVEPDAFGTALATPRIAASAAPGAKISTATGMASASAKLGHYINLAVQAYTRPVYYTAGAAVGFITAVRSELGLTTRDM